MTPERKSQPEATLASMPDDLWRRIAGYVAPRDSARNLLVASGRSSSLRGALLADIERTERALYGLTRLEAKEVLIDNAEVLNASATRRDANEAYLIHVRDWSENCDPNNLLTVRAFLACGVDPDYATMEDNGRTALMMTPWLARRWVDETGQNFSEARELAEILLKAGADIDATCPRGLTPLAWAFRELNMIILRYIDGADLDLRAALICAELISLLMLERYECATTGTTTVDVAHIRAQEAAFSAHVGNGDTFLHVTRRYASLGPDTAKDLFERIMNIHVWLRVFFELAEGRDPYEFPTNLALSDDEYDSRVRARVLSERIRRILRNGINAGLAAARAAAINAGLDGDALAEAVDADSIAEITEALNRNVAEAVSEAINRNVAETISDLTGDAAEAP